MGEKHSGVGTLYFCSSGVNGDLDWTPIGTFSELDISTGIDGDNNNEPYQPYAYLSRDKEVELTGSFELMTIERYEQMCPKENENENN